jgi:hypothetical protein
MFSRIPNPVSAMLFFIPALMAWVKMSVRAWTRRIYVYKPTFEQVIAPLKRTWAKKIKMITGWARVNLLAILPR